MKFKLFTVLLGLAITGCSSTSSLVSLENNTPPKNTENICVMLSEKPHWIDDLALVKKEYGVPHHVILAMMYQESRFVHDARPIAKGLKGIFNTRFASSAYGYSQALELTWADYVRATGVSGAQRDDFGDSARFMGWYIQQSNSVLKLSKWDAEVQYLAYHEGHGGYKKKSYNKKSWLKGVAKKVKKRSDKYWDQYQECGNFISQDRNFFVKHFL